MSKLTNTQSIILRRASTRPSNLAMPLPDGLHGAAAKMAVSHMIKRGWLEEVEANLRRKEPLWRETGDGRGTTLVATEAGLEAIGIEPIAARAVSKSRNTRPNPAGSPDTGLEAAADRPNIRVGTRQAQIIAMLECGEGASVAEIVAETGWLAHSVRGLISGALKKKLGLPITSQKEADRGTVYKLDV